MRTCFEFWGFFSDLGWGGSFNGLEEEDVATLDSSVVCGVNFSSNRPEFSGFPPAHSWIVYILLKKKSQISVFFILYIGRYLSNWASEKKNIYKISVIYVNRAL